MSIEHCPRCSARVRVPAMAEPESWVRCPRCRLESQLSEMLSAEPPELEIIDGPSEAVPAYTPALAGVGAEGDEFNDFNVTTSDTLVVDEDSPTLPLGGVALDENFLDDDSNGQGAMIGRVAKSEDDELFGFDDNPDVAALRTTSEDGKFVDVPADGEEEFNLSPDESAEMGAPAAPVTMGAGLTGIPTGVPRRKKKSGIVPMMIGVVGGGVFGILIAYFGILMWALEKDPFHVANMLPESMQMLVPEKLQSKSNANNNTPVVNNDSNPSENTPPMNEGNPSSTDNGSGDMNVVPAPSTNEPGTTPDMTPGTSPGTEIPATDPMPPLVSPEKTEMPKPANNTPDTFGNDLIKPADIPGVETPVKPTPNPADVFGNDTPIKPEMPEKPAVPAPMAEATASGPMMLAGANFAPEELAKSLLEFEAATAALAAGPEDPKLKAGLQAGVYKTLGHIGEVAGQTEVVG